MVSSTGTFNNDHHDKWPISGECVRPKRITCATTPSCERWFQGRPCMGGPTDTGKVPVSGVSPPYPKVERIYRSRSCSHPIPRLTKEALQNAEFLRTPPSRFPMSSAPQFSLSASFSRIESRRRVLQWLDDIPDTGTAGSPSPLKVEPGIEARYEPWYIVK